MFVDTHVHLDDARYAGELDGVIVRASQAGVGRLVSIGTGLEDSVWAADFAAGQAGVYATVGLHPERAETWQDGHADAYRALARKDKVVGIGESGLDYHHPQPSPALQKKVFRVMIGLAKECGLPLVVHQREAAADTLAILREEAFEGGGVFHCFAGDWDTARSAMDLGFFIAVGGILTFPNAGTLREVIRQVPMERLVLETDGPWLAPQARRGQRNEPAYIVEAARRLAELKGVSLEEVESATTRNALKLYRIA